MFGKIALAKDNLRRVFAGQFDHYEGHLVYRHLSKGPPIRLTELEHETFLEEFDHFASRLIWWSIPVVLVVMMGLVILDESGTLPLPDWVPIVVVVALLPIMIILQRRAMSAPLRALQGRPAMGGERSRKELERVRIQQLTWHAAIVPLPIGAGAGLLAFYTLPKVRAEYPWLVPALALFALWMVGASLRIIYLKAKMKP